jgi:hypothetical protein
MGPPILKESLMSRSPSRRRIAPTGWMVRARLAYGKQKTRDRYLGAGI